MTQDLNFSDVTPQILKLTELCKAEPIDAELYSRYNVYRGLRDLNGNGVRTGLTNISEVTAKKMVYTGEEPMDGKLFYRGIDVQNIVRGFMRENRFGFEETVYLLLFGVLPSVAELDEFRDLLKYYSALPGNFTRDVIMKVPGEDMMNMLARSVMTLYAYDDNPDDTSLPNVLRQCLQLIATMSQLAVYAYNARLHFHKGESLTVHKPDPNRTIAENIFYLLRPDQQYTELEARILDAALVLHAEHGGGNNSAFALRVVSSTGTDTYSAVAAALASLKGPKHGGANLRVSRMMADLQENVTDIGNEGQVADYLVKLLDKEAFDRAGMIYGVGHAVYSISDPRAVLFEKFAEELSAATGREKEYAMYTTVARLAPELIASKRTMYKGVSANIDFYSGFVYDMLKIPEELYTPLFAISRIAGWSAHRIEELFISNRVIRPAYKSVSLRKPYKSLAER